MPVRTDLTLGFTSVCINFIENHHHEKPDGTIFFLILTDFNIKKIFIKFMVIGRT